VKRARLASGPLGTTGGAATGVGGGVAPHGVAAVAATKPDREN
jgi:hypothetical protein